MTMQIVPNEAESLLSWAGLLDAFEAGHRLPKPDIKDLFVYRGQDTILDRATWIDGLGALVKAATVVPGNAARAGGISRAFSAIKSPAKKAGSSRMVSRTRTGVTLSGRPSALATRRMKRAPLRRGSISSTKPVNSPTPTRETIGAMTRAVRQGAGAVVYFDLKSSGKYGDVITAVHTPVARLADLHRTYLELLGRSGAVSQMMRSTSSGRREARVYGRRPLSSS